MTTNKVSGTLYGRLRRAGCEIDHHYSDLYVEDTPTARGIIDNTMFEGATTFVDALTGRQWLDIPFAYEPFWEEFTDNVAI